MSTKLVIFDMDGTVLDTLEDLRASMNYALSRHGFPLRTLEEIKQRVGSGLMNTARTSVPDNTDEATIQEVFGEFKSYYAGHLNDFTRPYPGIIEVMRRIKALGIPIGISSNKFDYGAKALANAHFGDLVDLTVGESELVPKKPDPTGTLRIMNTFCADSASTVYFGDSAVDIQTAKNANLECLCVTWGFRSEAELKEAGGRKFVHAPAEILDFIATEA